MRAIGCAFVSAIAVSNVFADNADIEIYTDYMIGKWSVSSSTATYLLQSSAQKNSYLYSMRVSMTPGQKLIFRYTWGAIHTHGFTHLEFYLHGGGSGNQQFNIQAITNAWPPPAAAALSNFATVPANSWVRVLVPLSAIGAENKWLFSIEMAATTTVPTFYIDDVRLVKAPSPVPASITIDPSATIRTLDQWMFGIGTYAWDWTLTSDATRAQLRDAGITMMTFPGGVVTDVYDWRTNTNKQTGTGAGHGTDGFLQAANAIGAQKVIKANYGSGTPQEARDWVEYTNVLRNGNVLYWGIGNEVYGPHTYDTHPYPHDAHTYAEFVRDAMLMMKAVDGRIKVGVEGTYDEHSYPQRFSVQNPRTGQVVNGWAPVLLTRLRQHNIVPDFYNIQYYPTQPGTENDSYLLQSGALLTIILQNVRQMLVDYLGPEGANVPIVMLENNSTWTPVGKQTTSIVNALYLAKTWGEVATQGVAAYAWWELHSVPEFEQNNHPSLYGWRNFGDLGVVASGLGGGPAFGTRYPTSYALDLLKRFARPGDSLVQAGTNHSLLTVYAVRAANGRVRVMVINMSRGQDIPATVHYRSNRRGQLVRAFTYGAAEDMAQAPIRSYSLKPGGPSLSMTFPKYSITVLEF